MKQTFTCLCSCLCSFRFKLWTAASRLQRDCRKYRLLTDGCVGHPLLQDGSRILTGHLASSLLKTQRESKLLFDMSDAVWPGNLKIMKVRVIASLLLFFIAVEGQPGLPKKITKVCMSIVPFQPHFCVQGALFITCFVLL